MSRSWSELPLIDRMVRAVERVRERLLRTTEALGRANVPYALCGSGAIAAWVASVDPSAVRNTPLVEVLLRRIDVPSAVWSMKAAGFVHSPGAGVDTFLWAADPREREAVRVFLAGEKLAPHADEITPDVADSEEVGGQRVVSLGPLIRMKLAKFSRVDRVDLRDLIGVGLIDASWITRFPPQLSARLRQLINTPEG